MRVRVEMTIESEDYSGKEFKKEIEKLIKNIDEKARLVRFKMYSAVRGYASVYDEKDINWKEE